MNVQVNWNETRPSPWIGDRLGREAERLDRLLPRGGSMRVGFHREGQRYRTKVLVHALGQDWWVVGEGNTFFQGLNEAFARLERKIEAFKRAHVDRVHRRWRYAGRSAD